MKKYKNYLISICHRSGHVVLKELNEQEDENEDVRDKMWAKRFAASYKRDYGDESDEDDDWNIQDEICTVFVLSLVN